MLQYRRLNLLLVEDHSALREIFQDSLTIHGHKVTAFESAEDALDISDIGEFDVALLDLNLPGEDGLYLAAQLRMRSPNIGIIMLTVRNEISDKLAGYNAGADIYLPKPVATEELNAAIQAVCRRISKLNDTDLTLNFATSQLSSSKMNSTISLSQEDSKLISLLISAPKQQLEYWELAEYLELDLDNENLRPILEKRISRLRKKLIMIDQPSSALKSIRGVGYKLNISVSII